MSLADIIRQRKQQAAGPASAQTMADLQRATSTGKATTRPTGPAISNIASQVAAQAGQAAQRQQQFGIDQQVRGLAQAEQQQDTQFAQQQRFMGQQQADQVAEITARQGIADRNRAAEEEMATARLTQNEEIQTRQITNEFSNRLADLASQHDITTNELFSWARQQRDTLSFDKFQANLESLGAAMALSDRKYTDEIRRIGQIQNLDDELKFREESLRLAMGQDMEILGQQFDLQKLINADEREYRRMIASMDINTALALADQAAKEQAYKNMITGVTNVATTLASQDWTSPSGTAPTDTTVGGGTTVSTSGNQTSRRSTQPQYFDPDLNQTPIGGFPPWGT